MKKAWLLLLLSFSLSAYADVSLDTLMTPDEQRITGVRTLTPQQKKALEVWIDKNFVKNPAGQNAIYLSVNLNNGQRLQLSDNSIYQIAPQDVPVSSLWITPFPIMIQPNNDPNYPVKLVNANTGVSVRAKKISS